jgi:hypothetical protein
MEIAAATCHVYAAHMANNGYLLNSRCVVKSAAQLHQLRSQPHHADGVVAGSSDRLLIPWLLCFRRENLPDRSQIADGGGLLCTTVEQAVRNLTESLPVLEAIAGSAALAKPYWHLACTLTQRLPFKYLALDAREIAGMTGAPEEFALHVEGAVSGGLSAIPHLKALSGYHDEVAAYPIDVLYTASSGVDRRSPRTWNASVLDAGYQPAFRFIAWHLPQGMGQPEAPDPAEDTFGELRGALGEIARLLDGLALEIRACSLGVSNASDGESLYVEVHAKDDTSLQRLQTDLGLRSQLTQVAARRLQPWCAKYAFAWAGYRYSVPPWAQH